MLSDMEVCAIAVQNSLERLFPEDPEKGSLMGGGKKKRTSKGLFGRSLSKGKKGKAGLNTTSTSRQRSGDEEAGNSDGDGEGDAESSSDHEQNDDELTTMALSGKVNHRDRKLVSAELGSMCCVCVCVSARPRLYFARIRVVGTCAIAPIMMPNP